MAVDCIFYLFICLSVCLFIYLLLLLILILILLLLLLLLLLSLYQFSRRRKKRNVLFNNALNTFYVWLYSFRLVIKDYSNYKRGNLLPPLHGLLFLISSKESFICIIPQRE